MTTGRHKNRFLQDPPPDFGACFWMLAAHCLCLMWSHHTLPSLPTPSPALDDAQFATRNKNTCRQGNKKNNIICNFSLLFLWTHTHTQTHNWRKKQCLILYTHRHRHTHTDTHTHTQLNKKKCLIYNSWLLFLCPHTHSTPSVCHLCNHH